MLANSYRVVRVGYARLGAGKEVVSLVMVQHRFDMGTSYINNSRS